MRFRFVQVVTAVGVSDVFDPLDDALGGEVDARHRVRAVDAHGHRALRNDVVHEGSTHQLDQAVRLDVPQKETAVVRMRCQRQATVVSRRKTPGALLYAGA